jgi:hypothetical protein
MGSRLKYLQKYRKNRYDNGLCMRCSNPRMENRNCCRECLRLQSKDKKIRSEFGLCRGCSNAPLPNRTKCSECLTKARWKRFEKLGLPPEEIEKAKFALSTHDKRCECCGTDKPGGRGEWSLDHDEKNKIFRGILCCGCNTSLGFVNEDIERLGHLTLYLLKHKT